MRLARRSLRISGEDDGLAAVDEDAVLEVRAYCPRQDDRLEIAAACGEAVDVVAVCDVDGVLLDDRALVEVGSRIVRRGADELDAASKACRYGFAPTNAGRNEWWMLMIGWAETNRSLRICM